MKELEKIPPQIREKYGVDYRATSGLLFILNPQPITIKVKEEIIEVTETNSGWMIRFDIGTVSILKDSFLTVTSIY